MNERAGMEAIARAWFGRAEEALATAREAVVAGRVLTAVGRLYYAAFYAVCAGLEARGLRYHKHTAVRAALHREFVNKGLVPEQMGTLFNNLFEQRGAADYEVFASFEKDEVEARLEDVRTFVDTFVGLVFTDDGYAPD